MFQRSVGGFSRGATLALAIALASASSACVTPPRQIVRIEVEPANASVFVDRKEFAPAPSTLSLATDRPHVLFFRAEGYLPQQIVLESRGRAGGHPALVPEEVRVRLAPLVPTERGVSIEAAD